ATAPRPRSPPRCRARGRAGGSRRRGARPRRGRGRARLAARIGTPERVQLTEEILARLRERYGEPTRLEWEGVVSEREHAMATYNPRRMHGARLFILNGARPARTR